MFSTALLGWYDANARTLPWRLPPNSVTRPDPYRVWLSEIMLQQTGVATVTRYFQEFTRRWPTVEALAAAPDEAIMAAWAGLGYYTRARNLITAARMIAARGFPADESGWRALPGVGPYTAAAITAIAFGERCAAVDTNVERVASRVLNLRTPLPAARAEIRAALLPLVPANRPGDFTQALMDLGSAVCTPRRPGCSACPVRDYCATADPVAAEALPVKPPPKTRPARYGCVWWIESGGDVALIRRPPRGLLGGMPGFPGSHWTEDPAHAPLPFASDWRRTGEISHIFTHFSLRLVIFAAELANQFPVVAGEAIDWTPRGALESAGLPTVYAKVAQLMLASADQPCFETLC
ncbi:MAG: A/G-specific adenine glycosylase [Sphingomonadaceae bacterium]